MVSNAYIHIPFCKSKCKYCAFISYNRPELVEDYVSALLKEIETKYQGEKLNTLYFGGGTPSLLPAEVLENIISRFNFAGNYELTLEVNPDDAGSEYFKQLKSIGINRLSIGSQTFNNSILKIIGRRHNAEQITEAVGFSKQAGFTNISLDLIYGLPAQTMSGLNKDMEQFLKLDIQHISTYGLKIEDESIWGKYYDKADNKLFNAIPSCKHLEEGDSAENIFILPDDDIQADMYEMINNILETNGFYRYEVSNFAKSGYESKHNLNYWNNCEYYGFGAAAHGYVNGIRYSNCCLLEDYIRNPLIHEYEKLLTQKEMLEEEIFLGFRKREGINVSKIKQKYGINFEREYDTILKKYSDFIEKTPRGYTLNLKGTLISNVILSEFI